MTSESDQPMVRKCYENLCRLCLGTDKLLQITTNEKIKNEIKNFIALDYIEIDIEDQLPNILCEKCLEKLRTWHQFKQKCLENYDILVKIIEDQTSNQSNHVNSEESDLEKNNDIKDRTKRQSKNKSKQCPICGVFLKDLKTHLLQHDDPEGKPFRCITCGKSYCRRIGLKLHVEREHLKIRYTCEKCAKICSTKTILKEHQKLHSDETNYKCDQCDKEFKSYKYLFKHKQWHAGIKKFVCSYCGKAFRVGESLKQHIRVHTGEKPYSCKDCEKCFQTPHHLKQHSRVHTGAKPFKCSFCDTCFGNKKSRDNHQNLHPEVESSKCNEYRVITVLPEMTESTNIQYESLEKNKNQILYIM